jgi:osmoprotectant transport system permease protein
LAELAARRRDRRLGLLAGASLLLVIGLGLWPGLSDRIDAAAGQPPVVVGAKTFSEQYILSRLIQDRLNAAGIPAETREGLGSTVLFDALASSEIDVYVDYTGTLWANHMKRKDSPGADVVLDTVTTWLDAQYDIDLLGALGFENAYALAMRRSQASELGIRQIGDLTRYAPGLSIGGDYEFFHRPEWHAVRDAYGLDFSEQRSFDSTLMYGALADGHVDVISAFSSDGRIAAFDLAVLDDDRGAFPPYDAVVLVSPEARKRPEVLTALQPLIGRIDQDAMQRANMRVDVDQRPISEVAAELHREVSGDANSGRLRR